MRKPFRRRAACCPNSLLHPCQSVRKTNTYVPAGDGIPCGRTRPTAVSRVTETCRCPTPRMPNPSKCAARSVAGCLCTQLRTSPARFAVNAANCLISGLGRRASMLFRVPAWKIPSWGRTITRPQLTNNCSSSDPARILRGNTLESGSQFGQRALWVFVLADTRSPDTAKAALALTNQRMSNRRLPAAGSRPANGRPKLDCSSCSAFYRRNDVETGPTGETCALGLRYDQSFAEQRYSYVRRCPMRPRYYKIRHMGLRRG